MYDFKSGLRLRENRQGDSQLAWPLLWLLINFNENLFLIRLMDFSPIFIQPLSLPVPVIPEGPGRRIKTGFRLLQASTPSEVTAATDTVHQTPWGSPSSTVEVPATVTSFISRAVPLQAHLTWGGHLENSTARFHFISYLFIYLDPAPQADLHWSFCIYTSTQAVTSKGLGTPG